jgi:hypothetical protein
MAPRSAIGRVLATTLLLLAVVFTYRVMVRARAAVQFADEMRTEAEAKSIATAIDSYKTEYNAPPEAEDNATFIRVLTHDNPRNITFLAPSFHDLNAKGEMVDAWGKPFLISIDKTGHSTVISPTMRNGRERHQLSAEALYRPLTGSEERGVQKLDGY